jgi:hypothetical protein
MSNGLSLSGYACSSHVPRIFKMEYITQIKEKYNVIYRKIEDIAIDLFYSPIPRQTTKGHYSDWEIKKIKVSRRRTLEDLF